MAALRRSIDVLWVICEIRVIAGGGGERSLHGRAGREAPSSFDLIPLVQRLLRMCSPPSRDPASRWRDGLAADGTHHERVKTPCGPSCVTMFRVDVFTNGHVVLYAGGTAHDCYPSELLDDAARINACTAAAGPNRKEFSFWPLDTWDANHQVASRGGKILRPESDTPGIAFTDLSPHGALYPY